MKYEKRIVLFTLFAMNLVDQPAPEIVIDQGILSGITSADGSYFEYIGIPYATTNASTRFKAPSPPPSWEGVYYATREYSCPQPTMFGIKGTEDCLKINVYVPAVSRPPLPVMVFIHGGAFFLGSGGKLVYGPDFLVKQDVILVTFNYRLGVLGFTCLGIEEAPGNAGLKDQVAALRWVKKNIAAFGGDPDNINMFGQSAGGTSASILLASNVTDGLFNKAIVQSGTSIASWSINREPLFTASLVAKELGYDTSNPKEIYEIFRKLSYQELVAANPKRPLGKFLDTELLHFPCIEKSFEGEEAVIPDLPYNMISKKVKDIPLMYGSTSNEGLFLVSKDSNETLKKRDEKYLFATDLIFPSVEEEEKIDKEARKYYFGTEGMNMKEIANVSRLMRDLYFEVPMLLEAEMVVKKIKSPIYYYLFNYSGGRNFLKYLTGNADKEGACHADELLYLFKGHLWPVPINNEDKSIIELMTKMWTNFAKYGNPTPEDNPPIKWHPSTSEELKVLHIDKKTKMGPVSNQDTFKFWKNVYEKYRKTRIKFEH